MTRVKSGYLGLKKPGRMLATTVYYIYLFKYNFIVEVIFRRSPAGALVWRQGIREGQNSFHWFFEVGCPIHRWGLHFHSSRNLPTLPADPPKPHPEFCMSAPAPAEAKGLT